MPRVNWSAIKTDSDTKIKGFIGYKTGMFSAYVKDDTEHSMTKNKKIAVPVTIIECPPMKIFSVRFYKDNKVYSEIISENIDKELKKIIRLPKGNSKKLDSIKSEDYSDISIIVHSIPKKTGIKKKPDLTEIGLNGSKEEKLNFVKENLGKEISVSSVFKKNHLVDVRGLTKAHGFSGPVKRFGIKLKDSKSEKGRRRPGSLGPWHPARVTFRVPQAGQLGMFTRIVYNNKIIDVKKHDENPVKNIKNYGDIKTEYLVVRGSIQGPAKRQLLLTSPLKPTKKQKKKNFELIELR